VFLTLLAALSCLLPQGRSQETNAPAHPVVATHYFYWYRWPTEHFNQRGAPGREGHHHHFTKPKQVSYLSRDWHEGEFRAMSAAGIDVALPVYWGAPGAYERPNLRFARAGLKPMIEALDAIAASGDEPIALGMFYDTSTLLRSVRGKSHGPDRPNRPDLTRAAGEQLFCRTVVEYFEQIPPRHWARFRNRPLVVLYASGFAGKWDRGLGAALRHAFAKRFPGENPWLVADVSWGRIGQDMTTAWGAALAGPKLFPSLAQIGPGYDDSAVPGRHTPIRDRQDDLFYRWSWRQAVRHRPELVLIETWNEMHEGTEICETIETGRRYLELTREWVQRLRSGDAGPALVEPEPPRLRPDLGWGAEARGATTVHAVYSQAKPERSGLREILVGDGPCTVAGGALHSRGASDRPVTYVYFQISDHWKFDVRSDCVIEVTRRDTGAQVSTPSSSRRRASPTARTAAPTSASSSRAKTATSCRCVSADANHRGPQQSCAGYCRCNAVRST